jgi:hypothetical protein
MNRILVALAGVLMLTGVAGAQTYWFQFYDGIGPAISTIGPFAADGNTDALTNCLNNQAPVKAEAPNGVVVDPNTCQQSGPWFMSLLLTQTGQFVRLPGFADPNACLYYATNYGVPYYTDLQHGGTVLEESRYCQLD